MRGEDQLKKTTKGLHFRGDDRITPSAHADQHRGVVHHASGTDPLHEHKGPGQEDLGLEPGEAGIELGIELAAIGQDKAGALGLNFGAAQHELEGRGVVLHFLSLGKDIPA